VGQAPGCCQHRRCRFSFVTEGGEPSFSSDGNKIVYEGYVPPALHTTEIFTLKVGGGGKFQVTHNTPWRRYAISPSWGVVLSSFSSELRPSLEEGWA